MKSYLVLQIAKFAVSELLRENQEEEGGGGGGGGVEMPSTHPD